MSMRTARCVAATRRWAIVLLIVAASRTVAAQGPGAVADSLGAAFNRHDGAAYVAWYASPGWLRVLGDTGTPYTMKAFAEQMKHFLATRTEMHEDVVDRMVVGRYVLEQHHVTHFGKPPTFDALLMHDVRDGKIVNSWETWPSLPGQPGADGAAAAAVVARLHRAFNDRNLAGIDSVLADTVIYHELADVVSETPVARAAARASFEHAIAQNPKGKVRVVHQIALGPVVALDSRIDGSANGQPNETIDIFQIKDGKIVAEWESQ